MPTELLFTVLPRRRDGDTLALSVHVMPRLTTPGGVPGVLADFPLVASWHPADLAFRVVLDGTTELDATTTSTSRPGLWTAVLPPTLPVRSFTPVDRTTLPIHTFPMAKIADELAAQYGAWAGVSPSDFPAIDALLGNGLEDWERRSREGGNAHVAALGQIQSTIAGGGAVDTRASSSTRLDVTQLVDFHAPEDTDDQDVLDALTTPVEEYRPDVHEVLQLVNQHPPLLRLLGLVFDIEVGLRVAALPDGPHTLQVKPDSQAIAAAGATLRLPETAVTTGPDLLVARPQPAGPGRIDGGWVRLDDDSMFTPVQVEVDGSGLKVSNSAGNLVNKRTATTIDTREDSALPALRTDGIAVVEQGRAAIAHDTFARGVGLEADLQADSLVLYAEDLVRGMRVDVADVADGTWRSLMQRRGEYRVGTGPNGESIPVEDEGQVAPVATRRPTRDDLYISEELFFWDGWSLVTPKPGDVLGTDPTGPPLVTPENPLGPDIDARFTFRATPGTLPRLRFGREYRFRARTVDLAGNALPPSVDDDSHATAPVRFGRLSPLQTPPVLLREPAGPAESMETVAVRSDLGTSIDALAQRHLAPPKVGQITVENHGLLDVPDPSDASQLVVAKAAYQLLVDRDDATFANHPDAAPDPADPDSRTYPVEHLGVTWAPDPAMVAIALDLLDGPHAGTRFVESLFDPAGSGAWPELRSLRLDVVDGVGTPAYDAVEGILTVPLRPAEVTHVRLSGVLDTDRVDEHLLWQWVERWLSPQNAQAAAQKRAELLALLDDGQHWMFEPFRRLTLVHAVRRPLVRPGITDDQFSIIRRPGDTGVELGGFVLLDRPSTVRIDVRAEREEPVDQGPGTGAPAPTGPAGDVPWPLDGATPVQITDEQVFDLKVATDGDPDELEFGERADLIKRHEFGDTKHRVVTYQTVGTSRFVEFFRTRDRDVPYDGAGNSYALDTAGSPTGEIVPGSAKVEHLREVTRLDGDGNPVLAPNGQPIVDRHTVSLTEGVHFTIDGGTTLTWAAVTDADEQDALPAVGDPVLVTYLVPPFTRATAPAGQEEDGEAGPLTVSIPSSARPSAPGVADVLPAFTWGDSTTQAGGLVQQISSRQGNLLRVYLERPWWSSGDGELLGVLLWTQADDDPQPLQDPDDPVSTYTTQWGEEPIHGVRPLSTLHPRASDFPRAVETRRSVPIPELPGPLPPSGVPVNAPQFDVVGHEVVYDPDRDLWYADIEVAEEGSYAPFVRLALVRFQPASIERHHVSSVVLADQVQLAPDRTALVSYAASNPTTLTCLLTGRSQRSVEGLGARLGTARMRLQWRDPAVASDVAWEDLADPVEMQATELSPGVARWSATVSLGQQAAPVGDLRLVVEQSESIREEPTENNVANPFIVPPRETERVVHTDVIPLVLSG